MTSKFGKSWTNKKSLNALFCCWESAVKLRRYAMKARDLQRRINCIWTSLNPCACRMTQAPTRSECAENNWSSGPLMLYTACAKYGIHWLTSFAVTKRSSPFAFAVLYTDSGVDVSFDPRKRIKRWQMRRSAEVKQKCVFKAFEANLFFLTILM